MGNFSEAGTQKRFDAVRERAQKLGVLDISFCKSDSASSLECYERTLDVIEKNKGILYQNAGETEE
jgi:hypothetical protein